MALWRASETTEEFILGVAFPISRTTVLLDRSMPLKHVSYAAKLHGQKKIIYKKKDLIY